MQSQPSGWRRATECLLVVCRRSCPLSTSATIRLLAMGRASGRPLARSRRQGDGVDAGRSQTVEAPRRSGPARIYQTGIGRQSSRQANGLLLLLLHLLLHLLGLHGHRKQHEKAAAKTPTSTSTWGGCCRLGRGVSTPAGPKAKAAPPLRGRLLPQFCVATSCVPGKLSSYHDVASNGRARRSGTAHDHDGPSNQCCEQNDRREKPSAQPPTPRTASFSHRFSLWSATPRSLGHSSYLKCTTSRTTIK